MDKNLSRLSSEAASSNPNREALLRSTLGSSAQRAIYSVRANFFVAFLGGAAASLLFVVLNTHRLGRLKQDFWFLIAAGIAAFGFAFWAGYVLAIDQVPTWLAALSDNNRGLRIASRGLALLLFGCAYLLHRRFYRAMELSGQDPPNPWKMGIACTVAGGLLQYGALALGRAFAIG